MSTDTTSNVGKRRVKGMLRHTSLVTIAALLLCAGVGAVTFHYVSQPTTLRFVVSLSNPEDARVVQAITAHLARERASVRARPVAKDGGSHGAAAAIDKREADIAIVRQDIAMPKEGQAVAILRKNVAVFIVPAPPPEPAKAAPPRPPNPAAARAAARKAAPAKAEAEKKTESERKPDVEKIEDLIGRRLGVIGRSQANIDLLKAVLRQYNIVSDKIVVLSSDAQKKPNEPDKVSVVQFDPAGNLSTQIRDSNVNAVLSVGPVSSPVTADAIAALTRDKEPPTFLKIGAAEALAERNPVYEATEIKAGAFGGSPPRPEESIETIMVHHYVVAHRKLSEDVIAEFARQLFNTRQGLASDATYAAKIEAPDTDKDAAVAVHPGAAAYIDGETKTFFDRYSDFIYLGLMIVSFFGSGLAGLVTYSRSGNRARRLDVLERLLAVTTAARTAETNQRLDELQEEADNIVAGMVRDAELKAVDQAMLTAFSIALEHAHQGLSDRRAALLAQPPRARPAVASI